MPESRARYIAMDGVRGVAALCVAAFHVSRLKWPPGASLMVDLFFCLSGFVLAGAYGPALDRGLGALAFMKRRLARLYPMYALALALGIGAHAAALALGSGGTGGPKAALIALNSLLMLPTMTPSQFGFGGIYNVKSPFPYNPASWSLFFELFANLVFAVLRPRDAGRALLLAAAAALAFAASVALLGFPGGWGLGSLWGGAPRVLSGFYLGCLIRLAADAGLLPSLRLPLLAPALTLAMALAPFGTENPAFLTCAILVSPLILVTALRDVEAPLMNRVYAELGRLSYPLYVLHPSAFKLFVIGGAVLTSARSYDPSPAACVLFLVAISLASWALAVHVEPRLRNLAAAILQAGTPAPVTNAA